MGAVEVILGLYATVLPFAVFGAWLALALWDLAGAVREGSLARGPAIVWTLLMLAVPVLAPPVYLLSVSRIPRWLGVTFVAGGVGGYVVVLLVTGALGAAG
jgi:hypothetical protein